MSKRIKGLTAAVCALAASVAGAKTCTFSFASFDNLRWSDASRWDANGLPAAGDDVVIQGVDIASGGGALAIDTDVPALKSLTFKSASAIGLRFRGGSITFEQDAEIALDRWCRMVVDTTLRAADNADTLRLTVRGNDAYFQTDKAQTTRLKLRLYSVAFYYTNPEGIGPAPAELDPAALVFSHVTLSQFEESETPITVAATRGITLTGGVTNVFSQGRCDIVVNAPITGDGAIEISRSDTHSVTLNGVNTYTGVTRLSAGNTAGDRSRLVLGRPEALPAGTTLDASATAAAAEVTLPGAGTVTTVANVDPTHAITFRGPGTLHVAAGAADFDAAGTALADGARFTRAGTGAVNPRFATPGVAYTHTGGTLVLTPETGAARPRVMLTADTAATVAEGTVFAGALLSADAADPVTLTLDAPLTVGVPGETTDLDVILAPAANVTLAGVVNTTRDTTAFAKLAGYLELPAATAFAPGDQTLAAGEARYITSVTQTGDGTEALTLAGASTVYLAAEGENDSLAAGYAVTLGGAESRLTLAGAGTVAFDGTVTGAGRMVLDAATVRAGGDWSGVTVEVLSGVLEVPAGETLTLGAVTGPLVKTGAGTLVLTGVATAEAYPALTVREGTARLAAPVSGDGQFCAGYDALEVATGARVVLDGDEQIAHGCSVHLAGTLDLNGHSVRVFNVWNGPRGYSAHTETAAKIVNTAATAGRLAANDWVFYGTAEENPGKITIDVREGNGGVFSSAGGLEVSNLDMTRMGSTPFLPYSRNTTFKFTFEGAHDATKNVAVTEIALMWKGKRLPFKPSEIKASSTCGDLSANNTPLYKPDAVYDAYANKCWRSDKPGECWIAITFAQSVAVDGYCLAYNSAESAPRGWKVDVYRYINTGYMTVDEQRNVVPGDISPFEQQLSAVYPIDLDATRGAPFGPKTDVALPTNVSAVRLRVESQNPFTVGAVTGAAGIRLENGSTFAPGDLSGWTGAFSTQGSDGLFTRATVQLDSTRGPVAQPVRFADPSVTVEIANGAAAPAAVLMEEAEQYGRPVDGAGPLGLVKRGAGVTVLKTEDAANTGVTKIEEGTLSVQSTRRAAGPVTARYIRIRPLEVHGEGNGTPFVDSYKFNWVMSEFQLLDAAGNVVAWPNGKTASAPDGFNNANPAANLFDGNLTTRCLVYNPGQSGTTSELSPVTIDAKAPVTFAAVRWYTSRQNGTDIKRTPVRMAVDVSDDGAAWRQALYAEMPFDAGSETITTEGGPRGPYALTGASTVTADETGLATLPAEHLVAGTVRETRAPALKAQYFKFRPWRTRNPNAGSNTSYGWMLSEISLWRNGQRLEWPSARTITCTGAQVIDTNQSRLTSLVNNITTGGTTNQDFERCFVGRYPCVVTINAHELVEFDAWSFTSSAGGGWTERLPVDFDLQISNDGQTWQLVDVHANEKMPETIYTDAGPWPLGGKFPLLTAGVPNRIGDASPVDVAAGATLQLATDYEKFGTLTGAGTVELDCGATAEINTDAAAAGAFSGVVTGAGTLVLGGAGVQTFDGADLSGVKTLEFNGGAMRGTLTSAGALRVTGAFRVALPDPVTGAYKATLITAGSLDAETRAVLEAAQVHNPDVIPGNYALTMKVTDTSATLHLAPKSLVIVIR